MKKYLKIAGLSLAGLVLLLSLSAVIYCASAGATNFEEGKAAISALFGFGKNDLHYRKSYSVSDRKAASKRNEVVATVGGVDLNNGQLQVAYWMNVYDFLNNYGQNAIQSGLDYTKPLDKQNYPGSSLTWQQYLLADTLDRWHSYQAMALLARDKGIKLADTFQKGLAEMRENMTKTAKENGYESLEAMIQSDMGPGCTFDDYYAYMETYYLGYMYYTDSHTKLNVSEEQVEAYFKKHESELAESKITKNSGDLVEIRQILIQPKDGKANENDEMIFPEASWDEALARAKAILADWEAGEKTEDTFIELAVEFSDTGTAASDGGLIEDIFEGYLTEELDKWCFEEGRKAGDCEIVKTMYGYHVVYFVEAEPEWHRVCVEGVVSELAANIMENAKEQYPATIDYKKIVLGKVDLNKK